MTSLHRNAFLFFSSATVHFDGELNVYYGLGNGKEWHHVSRNLLLDLRNGVSILKQNKSSISIQKVNSMYSGCIYHLFLALTVWKLDSNPQPVLFLN